MRQKDQKEKQSWHIVCPIILLETNGYGWTKEINVVQWYNDPPKVDIRWWSPERKSAGKGVTLTKEQLTDTLAALNSSHKALSLL